VCSSDLSERSVKAVQRFSGISNILHVLIGFLPNQLRALQSLFVGLHFDKLVTLDLYEAINDVLSTVFTVDARDTDV
jgi:hypothetical protein